jgi:hypothetical protein
MFHGLLALAVTLPLLALPRGWRFVMALSPSDVRRLAADLDRGLSLPASWYTDPTIAALKQERIFRRTWQYVGRTDQVAASGPTSPRRGPRR